MKYTAVSKLTFLYLSGIILQIIFNFPYLVFIIALPVLFLSVYLCKKYQYFLFMALLLGMFHTYLAQANYFQPSINKYYQRPCQIQGQIDTYPLNMNNSQQCWFKIKKINNNKVRAKINLIIKPPVNLNKNDEITFRGTIQIPQGPQNFGQPDHQKFYEQLQLSGYAVINTADQIIRLKPVKKNSAVYLLTAIRKDIQTYINQYYYAAQKSFLSTIILGDRVPIKKEIKHIFIATGTVHILAISGLHIGLITIILLSLFNLLGIPKKPGFFLVLFIIIFYNFLVGYRAPVQRATIMFSSIIICYLFDRDKLFLNSLSLAALIILLINPLAVKSISFQMSFLAVSGIIILTPYFNQRIADHLTIKNKYLILIKNIFTASLASQIFILPVLLFHFKQFSYISLIANILAIPLTTVILALTIITYLFFHLIPVISYLLANCTNFFIALLFYILQFFSIFKPLKYYSINPGMIITYYLFILYLFRNVFFKYDFSLLWPKKIRQAVYLLLFTFLISTVIYPLYIQPTLTKSSPQIMVFNIPGQCLYLKTGDQQILINCGYKKDIEEVILPFLREHDINVLNHIIITDFSKTQSQGLLYLYDKIKIKNIFYNGCSTPVYRKKRILEIIRQQQISSREISADNDLILDKIKIHPSLYPGKQDMSLLLSLNNKNILLLSKSEKRAKLPMLSGYKKAVDICYIPEASDVQLKQIKQYISPKFLIINKHHGNKHQKTAVDSRVKTYFMHEQGAVMITLDQNIQLITSYASP